MSNKKTKSAKTLSMEAVMKKTEEERAENEELGVLLVQAKQAVKEYRDELEKVGKVKPVESAPKVDVPSAPVFSEPLIEEGDDMLIEDGAKLPEVKLPEEKY